MSVLTGNCKRWPGVTEDALILTIRNGKRRSGLPHHREVQASPDYTGLLSLKTITQTRACTVISIFSKADWIFKIKIGDLGAHLRGRRLISQVPDPELAPASQGRNTINQNCSGGGEDSYGCAAMEISSNQEGSEMYHLGERKNKTRTPFSVNSEATSLATLCVEA